MSVQVAVTSSMEAAAKKQLVAAEKYASEKPLTSSDKVPSWTITTGTGNSSDSDETIEESFTLDEQLAATKLADAASMDAAAQPATLFQGVRGAAAVMAAHNTVFLPSGNQEALEAHAQRMILEHSLEHSFYVLDLGVVVRLHRAWVQAMPRVKPFYAVKCHPNMAMMGVLAGLGAGFDCASQGEIELVTSLGVPVDRIIYAHPCKPPAQIKFAAANNVNMTTFDTESELHKVARWHPATSLLLRIRADDTQARCQLGNKFGADPVDALGLLGCAKDLGLKVAGVSFHVGSGATNPGAFTNAISLARKVFDMGAALGFEMTLLDIGGGFCGGNFDDNGMVDLGGVPAAVNSALDQYFPESSGIRVIAEPGRYFAEAAASLILNIYGQRERKDLDGNRLLDYWVSDGLYGSLNCIVYDHASPTVSWLRDPLLGPVDAETESTLHRSTLFGPTCDGLDTIVREHPLPALRNGDWIVFPRMGAYSIAGATNFNGFDVCGVPFFYVCSEA
jgi:ornithine decarboxylase